MKPRSFRLRLALWSALLAGVTLLSFAASVDWQMRRDKIAALDRAIRLYTEREASHPSASANYWQRVEKNLSDLFAHGDGEMVILLVQSDERLDYQSAPWSSELDANNLPWLPLELPPDSRRDRQVTDGKNQPFPPLFRGFPPPANLPPPVIITQLASSSAVWRIGLTTTPFVRLAIGINVAVIDNEMAAMRKAFWLAVPPALLFIGLGAAILSERTLTPLRRLTTTMQHVTAKGLQQRIPLGKEDKEFSELIEVFNDMLQRLERSFMQASRFSADAAHELKTPLAILQGQIEQTMSQVEAGSLVQIRLSSILDEIQRLSTISRKLLLLSLADAGRLRLHKVNFNLSQALEELVEDAQMLAPQLDVTGNIAANLFIQADADLLRQVLHNLISNAIKYNMPAAHGKGRIRITARRNQQAVELSITNTATAIAVADQARLFERFYRADSAHGRQIDGVGLGLSLSREIALAHGGDLLLAKAEVGEVRFLLIL